MPLYFDIVYIGNAIAQQAALFARPHADSATAEKVE
jgi:hypothetical protein